MSAERWDVYDAERRHESFSKGLLFFNRKKELVGKMEQQTLRKQPYKLILSWNALLLYSSKSAFIPP